MRNEDAAYADVRTLAVADGIGGHPAGDVAASLVIGAFSSLPHGSVPLDGVELLREAAQIGNEAIAAHVARNRALDGMGTTLTTVRLDGFQLGLLHVGDSRAYLLRQGILYQLSHDHTLVQSLVDGGVISSEEARSHPRRNVVIRVLMGREPRFTLTNFEVQERDRLLMSTDGVSDVLSDDSLRDLLAERELNGGAEVIVRQALLAGATDNVTCVVAEVTRTAASSEPVFVGAAATSGSDDRELGG